MPHRKWVSWLSAGLLACAVAVSATAAPRAGDIARGRDKAETERCTDCHLKPPEPGMNPVVARLAGQNPAYLAKQLQDFIAQRRKSDLMRMMVRNLEPEEVSDIVAYFASLPRMGGDGAVVDNNATGRRLFTEGDAARGILACVLCHGERGQGGVAAGGPVAPVLAGQDVRYLSQQLIDWRMGFRNNSEGGVMNLAVKGLSDAEIEALSGYLGR